MSSPAPSPTYGNLCSIFYDATNKYAPDNEVDFYASFAQPGGRILEAMCGSGRLLIPLMQRGYTVDGVDRSTAMLNRCRQRGEQFGLTPQLYEQSIEDLTTPHRYDTVTIAIGSFQLITDRAIALQALKKIHAHMHPGGTLLIDIFMPDTTSYTQVTSTARIDAHTTVSQTIRYVFDEHTKVADAFCFYQRVVNGTVQQQEDELVQLTWYTDAEITQLLNQAGFEVVEFCDHNFRNTGLSRVVVAKA